MKNSLHRLLRKQIKRDLGLDNIPDNLAAFIQSVNVAYLEFENDRGLMERSIDISSREYNERTAQLKDAKEQLADLVKAIPQGVMLIDGDGKISFANSAAEHILGLPVEELIGKAFDNSCWRLRKPDGRPISANELPLGLIERTNEPVVRTEYIIIGIEGDERTLSVSIAPLHNSAREVTGTVLSMEDITVRKQMEGQLKYLSLHDSLTGLYNRAFFEEEIRRLGTGRYNPIGVIFVDINGLKLVNDTLGHEKGDRLLLAAADIIRRCFRQDDVLARIGGDEFAILLTFSIRREVEQACRQLQQAVEQYNSRADCEVPFSLSIGFAVGDLRSDVNDLVKEADNNMYREKLHQQQSARSAIVNTLTKAMEARDFATEGHADRMRYWAQRLAEAIGLDEGRIADVRLFAHFHDIGKVGIADRILLKPGPLTRDETAEMRLHCEIGHRIAEASVDLAPIADWILKHHEWWNGQGYPLGLKNEEIPLECRIMAIVDSYDAMTSDRPYRKALSREQAKAELRRCSGTQFDPELVKLFLRLLDQDADEWKLL